ncbi:signal peptidase I [Flavobacterium sp. XS1P32]|uniref:signal peptidase I n=1 Tax=Flavobacterium sp. XS1P32 TaxID=3401726 RepID=UPI003AADCC8F
MKKIFKILLIIFATLFISYNIIAQTGILKAYKNSTIANEPNLKLNSRMLVSNLVSAEIGDFVCYKYEDNFSGKLIRIHRLCGKENDTLQIVDGIVYLNKVNIDKEIKQIHFYQVSKKDYLKIKSAENISDDNFAFAVDENNVKALLEDSIAKKYGLTSKRIIEEKGKLDETIKKVFKNNWNKDNFGPLVIPKGKIFVLGDNRDNSEDSRYLGLINETEIVGVVVSN